MRHFRPDIDYYFLSICEVIKRRGACLKYAVGSIIVFNKRIVSTGYNGTPTGTVNCYNGGCIVCNNSEKISTYVLSCTCIHAEYGCIMSAGIYCTPGASLYSTKMPCLWCAKLIVQARIKEVVYLKSKYAKLEYANAGLIRETLAKAGIRLKELEHYLGYE